MQSAGIPTTGQITHVRQRHYLVEDVIPPPHPDDSALVRLACVDDDNQGQRLDVLWDREIDATIVTGEAWKRVAKRGFDPPRLFAAYYNSLRWNCLTATDPRLFQSPFRAGIRLDSYQLEPLRKALLLPRVNLFIADDVGLGKTIEAGLILRELLIRKKAREIVVACPPSMLLQWREELDARFGLPFQILDRQYVKNIRQERGFGVNPWTTHSWFLISTGLLIDEAYAAPLRDWLGDSRPGTILVLDEAHHAAPASGQRYAIDSHITRTIRDLAPRFEHRLLLSATPHNGHSNSFSALLEILDPQRFCRGVPVQSKMLERVMVRRLKDDLRKLSGGFPIRRVVQIDIDNLPVDAPELRLSALLDEYRTMRETRLKDETRRRQATAGLLTIGLQQRLLSSIEAFARTLRVHRRTMLRHWDESRTSSVSKRAEKATVQLDLLTNPVGADDDRAALPESEIQSEEDSQFEAATVAGAIARSDAAAQKQFAAEQAILEQMTEIADASRHLPDARVRHLLHWLRQHCCPAIGIKPSERKAAAWTNIRVLIFTEYEDTKSYLLEQLESAIQDTELADERIAVFHGPTPPEERERIKKAFNSDPAKDSMRILIATDAAREGLNLQPHCWNLFHFDVPWNPSRLEQRNGRIDRKLQDAPEVFCHYFFYKQRPEDCILAALIKKTETIRIELGSLSKVIDDRLADKLKSGIRRSSLDRDLAEIEAADLSDDHKQTMAEELDSARERETELKAQVDRLRELLEESKNAVGLDQSHLQAALSCSLELLGAPPLSPLPTAPKNRNQAKPPPERFRFPALDEARAADPTWASTLDSLRPPRLKDQTLWEWRRSTAIRPVVFDDPGNLEGDVVHFHLEHRVVRRLLDRFSAQGFIHDDLSRACLVQTSDALPRILLLGRLCLYGPNAARLHEAIVPITARWIDPSLRKGPLTPYAREAEGKTMQLLETALASPGQPASTTVLKQLAESAPNDVIDLLPHLQDRGMAFAADAEKKLRQRADAEAKAMQEILESQRKHILSTAKKYESSDRQGILFPEIEDELRQLEANRRHWAKRLGDIEAELESEPERIRQVYDVKAKRVEPVGLVYLWPVTG